MTKAVRPAQAQRILPERASTAELPQVETELSGDFDVRTPGNSYGDSHAVVNDPRPGTDGFYSN